MTRAGGNPSNRVVVGSSSPSAMEDSASPYFLHNGDHPGIVLVSSPLTGSNYNTWSRAMVMALTAKNKIGFVDGSIPRPETGDLLSGVWIRCNSMVISWILNAVSRDIADSLLYIDSAAEIWIDLHERFHQSNGPRIFQMKTQLVALHQGALDVSTYFTRLKILWEEMKMYQPIPVCRCGGMKSWMEYQQQECVMQFLMGLNESFTQTRAQILLMDPLPPLTKVFSLVVQEERQRGINGGIPAPTSLAVGDSSSSTAQAAAVTNSSPRPRRDRPTCTHCGLQGHTMDKCYRLHGFPSGFKPKPRQVQPQPHANQVAAVLTEERTSDSTVRDLTSSQCQQLIALLNSQLQTNACSAPASSFSESTTSISVSQYHFVIKRESANMAELVAEAFLTVAFEKLFKLLVSQEFRSFFQGKKLIDDQLGLLNVKLKTASLLLNDAEDRQITDERVKEWLDELKDVIFRADDLVEEIKAEARSKQESESSTNALKKMVAFFTPFTEFDKTVRGEIENILKDLSFLLERASAICLKHIDRAQNMRSIQRSPAPLLEESHVHGRDDDKQEILKLLLSDEIWGNKIGVLPIVGMGGLGKTTLARLVYDDDRVKTRGFHHKAWVTVSTEFDIFRITKIILQQVCPQMTSGIEEVAELQGRLKEALRGKKFLFVLDDVWDENYDNWDSLRSAFLSADSGSRIIVTTRSQKVASNVKTGGKFHQLLEVSNEDCWKIFVDHAFNGDSVLDPRLQEIGEKIVGKCKGLPLAVRSVGGLLRSVRNPETWESILRNHVWSKNLRNNILPGLWLSYSCLPSSLKQCFAYCSIFPKDYEFEKKNIILLWMAEGFLQSDAKDKRMEEVGGEYFDELMARSLFQRSNQDESTFVMHDLVHDLAIFVSGEACFRVDDATNVEQATKKTRYISVEGASSELELCKGRFEAKHLRTFLSWEFHLSFDQELVKEVLNGERYLRVLSKLAATDFQTLNDSFCKLKHLRYLDMSDSGIEEIPCLICTLSNLQTLLLSRCRKLTWLPKDMGRLIRLRHLDTTNTPLKEMPPRMGNLKELQTLTDFVLGKDGSGSRIQELEALQHLHGKLRISGLQNIDNNSDILKVHCLRDKEKLTVLGLEWEGEVTDTRRSREALNALEPHTNLRNLVIYKYAGLNFPDWLGRSSFSKLESISLSGNEYCSFLPPLGQLPSLRELVIKNFHGVEKIGDEFYNTCNSSTITPFQSLEILEFFDMKSWKEWSFIGRDGKEGKSFPRLKRLCFDCCPNLAGSLLPDCDTLETLEILESFRSMKSLPLDKFPKLKKLRLQSCENLKELIVESPDVIETLYIRDCNKLEFPRSRHYVHARELTIDGGYCDYIKSLPLDYFPRLEVLKLDSCQNLESLTFTERTSTAHESLINSLNIFNCMNFRSLPEHMHRLLPSLSVLKMNRCPQIGSFPEGGLPLSLKLLVIWACCELIRQHKHWDLQKLTSLTSLRIGRSEDIMLDAFPEGLLPSSLTRLELNNLPHLKGLNGTAFQNVASLYLWIEKCNELQLLPEEILQPTRVHDLFMWECPFLERRYHRERGEDWHKISRIPTISIGGWTTRHDGF